MSSRSNALWYCHECQAEMQPLMVPGPQCAVCHGSFVEQLDPASEDDPRNFVAHDDGPLAPNGAPDAAGMPGLLNMLFGRMALGGEAQPVGARPASAASGRRPEPFGRTPSSDASQSNEWTFRLGPGTLRVGGGINRGPGDLLFPLPPSSPPLRRSPSAGTPPINPFTHLGPLPGFPDTFQQYVLALLNGADSPFGHAHLAGRAGDYVFSQEALDTLMTQLMEGGGGGARPASQETLASLPRSTVGARSDLRSRECAVCKDEFEVGQQTVALPCTHSFHNDCILPWLEINGTCPVCRTPADGTRTDSDQAGGNGDGRGSGGGRSSRPRSPRSPGQRRGMPGGLDYVPWESLD